MMTNNLTIRPARQDDAGRAAVLLYSAYLHQQVNYPLQEVGENQFIERLQYYFHRAGNRFSYQNIQVAEQSSEVLGLVLSFGGRDEARLNTAVGSWLEREAQDEEWYIDALPCSKIGATRESARACYKLLSSRRANTTMLKLR